MKVSRPILAVVIAAAMASTTAAQREPRFEQAVRERRAAAAAEKAAWPQVRGVLRDVLRPSGAPLSGLAASSLIQTRDGAVAVTIRAADAPRVLALLEARGRTAANAMGGVVEAYLTPADVAALAADPAVVSLEAIARPRARAISQGVAAHNADRWHTAGLTGAGVKVGIVDIGFLGISTLVGTELPEPAGVRCYVGVGKWEDTLAACDTYSDHGTAVAESLSDVAPAALLYLATPYSALDLATSVNWMVSQGVEVINVSVSWIWDGPGDGTSPNPDSPLKSIDAAVAGGSLFVTAAGNGGRSAWFGGWHDRNRNNVHEFAVSGNGTLYELNPVVLVEGQRLGVDLRWGDSWTAAARDIDLYLWDPVLEEVVAASEEVQAGRAWDTPIEALDLVAPRTGVFEIVVVRYSGQLPPWLQLLVWTDQALTYRTPYGGIENPAESANPGMLTVGAAPWHTPTALEPFSSRGPTPDFRVKPDLVGADRGETVTRGAAGYAGTSQAAAHVSGLAALAKGTLPTASPARLAAYLKNFARPRGPVPNVEWGYGFAALPGGVEPLTPSEPRKLTATVQNQTVTLTWQPPLVGAPAGYSLEVGSGPGLANLATLALGNTLTYTTPAPNGTYYVRLRARSASGLGPASSEQVVVVGPSPGPPAGLQAIVDGANVKLTWSAAATGGPPTGYVLVASPTRGGAPLARFTVTTPALSAVNVPAGTYYVRVHATNAAGMSAPSTELVVVVAPGSR